MSMPRQLARVTHDWEGLLAHPHSGQACRPSLVGTMRARHRGQSVGCRLPLSVRIPGIVPMSTDRAFRWPERRAPAPSGESPPSGSANRLSLVDFRLGVDAGRGVFAALSPPFLSFEGFGEFAAVDLPAGARRPVAGARGVQQGDRIVEVFEEGGGVPVDSTQGGSGGL